MTTTIPSPLGGIIVREEPASLPGEQSGLLPGITVAIPTVPPRVHMLLRALASVAGQSRQPDAVTVAWDLDREGAPRTRDRAIAMVRTEWTAFLDDDDEFGRDHLMLLEQEAEHTGADLVFPWFTVVGGMDPFPQHFGQVWDIGPDNVEDFRHIPITCLIRTRIMRELGGFEPWGHPPTSIHPNTNEDLGAFMEVVRRGYKVSHLPVRTWLWHHHGGNLSGKPLW